MRVVSGTIHDNPWEGIGRDEEDNDDDDDNNEQLLGQQTPGRQQQQWIGNGIGTTAGRHRGHFNRSSDEQRRQRHFTCTDWTLHTLVQAFLGMDMFGCLFWFIYGLVLLFHHQHQQQQQGGKQHHDDGNEDHHHTGDNSTNETDEVPDIDWINSQDHSSLGDDGSNYGNPAWPTALALELSIWLGLRVLSVTAALYYSHVVNLCGLLLASYISAVLAFQTALLSILSAIYGHRHAWKEMEWWHGHFLVPNHHDSTATDSVSHWFLERIVQPWLWLILLGLAVSEFPVRYFLYHQYRQRLMQQEEEDLRQTALLSRAATLRRPWWWSSPSFSSRPVEAQSPRWQQQRPIPELDYLRQALLDDYHDPEGAEGGGGPIGLPDWIREENDSQYQSTSAAVEEENTHRRSREFAGTDYYADEQPSSSSNRSSSFFSSLLFWRTGRNSNHDDSNNNLRDDGSIDFASVQEEWASRSEEDPLWWARDQQQQQQPKEQEQPDVFSGFGGSAKPQSQSRTPTKKKATTTMATTPSSRSKHHNGITNPQEAPSPRLQVPEYVNARTADADKASAESVVSEI